MNVPAARILPEVVDSGALVRAAERPRVTPSTVTVRHDTGLLEVFSRRLQRFAGS